MLTIIRQHGCDSLTEFTSIQASNPEGVNVASEFGHQGNCIKISTTATNTECSIRETFTATDNVKIIRFYHRLADENLTANYTIAHGWYELAGNSFGGDLFDITLVRVSNNSYTVRLTDLVNNIISNGTRVYYTDRQSPFRPALQCFNLTITSTGLELYVNDGIYPADYSYFGPDCVITGQPNYGNKNLGAIALGKYFSAGYAGNQYIDTIKYAKAQSAPATALKARTEDVIDGILWRQLCPSGAIVKSAQDTTNLITTYDIVGEATTYALKECIISDRRVQFDQIQGFIESTLIRKWAIPGNCLNGKFAIDPTNAQTPNDPGELNLQGYLYDPRVNKFIDIAIAGDDIVDEIECLLLAHKKWGSTSTLNYLQLALVKAGEIKTAGHYTGIADGLRYFTMDQRQNQSNVQTNMSYMNWMMYRLLKEVNPDLFWDQAIEGGYKMLGQTTGTTGIFATPVGLPTEWHAFNRSTGAIQRDTVYGNTTNYPPNGLDTHYGFNAFRTLPRIYLDWKHTGDPRGQAYLSGNIYQFFKTEWDTNGNIKAEYEHSGGARATYESGLFTACALAVFLAAGDTTRYNAIYSFKITSKYVSSNIGSYYDNAGYYLNDWIVQCIAFYEDYYDPLLNPPTLQTNFFTI